MPPALFPVAATGGVGDALAEMLRLLAGEDSTSDLASRLGVSIATASAHVALLRRRRPDRDSPRSGAVRPRTQNGVICPHAAARTDTAIGRA